MKKNTIITASALTLLSTRVAAGGASSLLGDILFDFMCDIYEAVYLFVGPIAILLLIYAGAKWLWSQEDPGERHQSRYMMENILIGLMLILIAGALVALVLQGSGISGCSPPAIP